MCNLCYAAGCHSCSSLAIMIGICTPRAVGIDGGGAVIATSCLTTLCFISGILMGETLVAVEKDSTILV